MPWKMSPFGKKWENWARLHDAWTGTSGKRGGKINCVKSGFSITKREGGKKVIMQPMLRNHSQNIKTGVNLRLGHVRLIIVYSGPAQPTQINLNIPTCTLEIFSHLKKEIQLHIKPCLHPWLRLISTRSNIDIYLILRLIQHLIRYYDSNEWVICWHPMSRIGWTLKEM